MANKIVKIPVKDVQGLRSDGGYLLRYRIKSKNDGLTSDWSELQRLSYPRTKNILSETDSQSFYELYVTGNSNRPLLTDTDPDDDPHDFGRAYSVNTIISGMGADSTKYITSSIDIPDKDNGILVYSWDSSELQKYPVAQEFDVYLSYRTEANAWGDWVFAGTTSSYTFSFKSPGIGQYVQAAVFLSSYPKLTNIYRKETNFVSLSPIFNAYKDSGTSTLGTVSGSGPFVATITGLTQDFPAFGWAGRRVYVSGSNFGEGKVTVRNRVSASSIVVESNITMTAGTLTQVRLV
jgi:hypothetical protein